MARRALALAVEIRLTRRRIAGQHILCLEDWRTPEGIVDPLTQKMREVDDLLVAERRGRRAALHLVSALQERSELVAIPIP